MKQTKSAPLTVQFFASQGKIDRIDITENGSRAMAWEFVGEKDDLLKEMISRWMSDYCQGIASSIKLPLRMEQFPLYTQKVLQRLEAIPFGTTISYKELALLTENEKAARAVGNACGKNLHLLVIPCHRVIASDGSLGGFALGLNIKSKLLNFERRFNALTNSTARSTRPNESERRLSHSKRFAK